MMASLHSIQKIRLGLASPECILAWSSGEVKKPETLNYRTLKPEKDGLFCERLFGPVKDWTCACGKYKKRRNQGKVCEACGVEITRAHVRRSRMGHIELACPVTHPWYGRGSPSKIALLLDLPARTVGQLFAYERALVTSIDHTARVMLLQRLKNMLRQKYERSHAFSPSSMQSAISSEREYVQEEDPLLDEECSDLEWIIALLEKLEPRRTILELHDYCRLRRMCGDVFRAGVGAEVIYDLLTGLDLDQLARSVRFDAEKGDTKALKRLKVIEALRGSGQRPEWMILKRIPVLPPALRPVIPVGGSRIASADLNELYCRVIQRNQRLQRMIEHEAPDIILWREKAGLQAACNALFDNKHLPKPFQVTGVGGRPLKSLTDILSGKGGRLRRNLLGKRVDYSGRSVICVGPATLKLSQCGIPKKVALELFKPFLLQKILKYGLAHNYRAAVHFVERQHPGMWDVLVEAMSETPVLLNRAPTLHRLSIQAFEPILVDGDAIQLHPLVCSAFNADFDGDQMAVHVPLSAEARQEARELMLSTQNLLSPATGEPVPSISQDIVLGCFYLTQERPGKRGEGRVFSGPREALLAYEYGYVDLQARISVRIGESRALFEQSPDEHTHVLRKSQRFETTVGRLILNGILPPKLRYQNYALKKEHLKTLLAQCLALYGSERVALMVDEIKRTGFRYATKAGISFAMSDVKVPEEKALILAGADRQIEELQNLFREGLITDQERYQRTVAIWNTATDEVTKKVEEVLDPWGTVYTIAKSGATKAKFQQIRQLSGMRGLMSSPSGKIIETPVRGNFYDGLSVLEYFVSSSGARSSLMKRSLSTASSGYLTRRLVEVAQDVIIYDINCGTTESLLISLADSRAIGLPTNESRLLGRVLAENIRGYETLSAGTLLTEDHVKHMMRAGIEQIRVRSVLGCLLASGVCQHCYGHDPARGAKHLVKVGTAVGIIAGQSIGEPGTQLSMRAFHTGGIAGAQGDIAQGLPRVEEVFEARRPKEIAPLCEETGVVQNIASDKAKNCMTVTICSEGEKISSYILPPLRKPTVQIGQILDVGTPLCQGDLDPRMLLHLLGLEHVQRYLVVEAQRIYRNAGVYIHDKHMEVIIRQMTQYVRIKQGGDTTFVPGVFVRRPQMIRANAEVLAQGGTACSAEVVLLGMTQATLAASSFLAAASFQETSRVLADAALSAQSDPLVGLKENVIVGKMIPAGTGFSL